ncbi:NosD domain-containing protein [Methanolobus profundi]|uniref:PEF-CTERM protein sorting domain-containing protein n=1 Tax=Methanolobus profundi TaxID=487685 RepID=A0A1I4SSU8_9EURY|nr:NosD domain-containing protein [Methanolobus profundi]SFM67534.1 PEF-CTERM protein sorting domain-containing protein [Methanolobus profundi]
MIKLMLIVAVAILFTGTASAAVTYTVDDDGGQDFTTIGEAVTSADWGDRIIVYPGIYSENDFDIYKIYSIVSYSGDPSDTIIEYNGSYGRFSVDGSLLGGESILLSGFTINNYKIIPNMCEIKNNILISSEINGGFENYASSVKIYDNVFEGKGVSLYRASPSATEIVGNHFYNCSIALNSKDCSQMNVENNEFSHNNVAIRINYAGINLVSNKIYDNDIGIAGGNSVENVIYNNYFNNTINTEGLAILTPHTFSVPVSSGPNIIGGPSIGGNYWAKPDGTGFSQTHSDTNSDGFCDEQFEIYGLGIYSEILVGIDYYPLADWIPANSSQKAIYTVDDDGGKDFLTIKEAVDAIPIDSLGVNEIIVYPGTYTENIEVYHDKVTIRSYSGNPEDTVINGDGGTVFDVYTRPGYKRTVFVLDGFTVTGAGCGVSAEKEQAYYSIYNNVFDDNEHGILMREQIEVDIHDNVFQNNDIGMKIKRCTIYDYEIRNNTLTENDIGIESNDNSVTISNNRLYTNNQAIVLMTSGSKLINNKIYDNNLGIYVAVTGRVPIINNYLNNTINTEGIYYNTILNGTISTGPNIVGGPSIGGNYWAKPDGTGFSQTHPDNDGDGFCDEEYEIYNEYGSSIIGVDHYPLAKEQSCLSNAEVPEFPTIALPLIAIVGLALFFKRR